MDKYPSISYGRPGQTPPPPPAPSGQQERVNQINELFSHFPNCRPVTPDRSVIDIPFGLPDGRSFALRVTLPPNFPQDRPTLSVSNQLIHPWVGFGGQLNFPSLQNWRFPSSRLLSLVQEAYGALGGRAPAAGASNSPQPRPPPPLPANPRPPAGTATPPSSTPPYTPPYTSPSTSKPAESALKTTNMEIPTEFPSLQTMQSEELVAALHNQQAFNQLLLIIADELQLSQMHKNLRASNLELAQRNLQKEAALSDIKNQIAVIRSAEYTSVMEEFQEKRARVESLVSKLTPDVLMANLGKAAAGVDTESQTILNKFMSGSMPVDEFISHYGVLRTLYHKRDLKKKAAMHTMN